MFHTLLFEYKQFTLLFALCTNDMRTKKTSSPKERVTLAQTMEKHNLHYVKPRACDCPTAFFYSQIPCVNEPHDYTGGTNNVFMFEDAVYNKANSYIYALDTDGALLIKTGGTYFATLKVDMPFGGDITNAYASATMVVETPNGFAPYSTQQIAILMEPLTAQHGAIGRAIFHANAVIHVADPLYGIGTNGASAARVYLWYFVNGDIQYNLNMEFTVRN